MGVPIALCDGVEPRASWGIDACTHLPVVRIRNCADRRWITAVGEVGTTNGGESKLVGYAYGRR